jgi:hypothetical protein
MLFVIVVVVVVVVVVVYDFDAISDIKMVNFSFLQQKMSTPFFTTENVSLIL